jgi:hypothetical protein
VVRNGALHRLADPPRCVRRELEAATPVELLDRAVQAERSLLDQVEEGHAEPAIALRDRHDEPQVRLDHVALGDRVAALDALRELHLLRGVQQLVPADVSEEQLQRVGRAGERLARPHRGLGGLLGLLLLGLDDRRTDLEAHRLELARDLLDLLRGELLLGDEPLELRGIHPPALLRALHDRLQLVGFEQFDELVLRQACGSPFASSEHNLPDSTCVSSFFPRDRNGKPCHKPATSVPDPVFQPVPSRLPMRSTVLLTCYDAPRRREVRRS